MVEPYPAIEGTFFEQSPKDVRRELAKIIQACPYRVRLETGGGLVRITIESFDVMSLHHLVWPMNRARAASLTGLLDLIDSNTAGDVRMSGGLIIRHVTIPAAFFGTIYILDPTGTVGIGAFANCSQLIQALRDVREILLAL